MTRSWLALLLPLQETAAEKGNRCRSVLTVERRGTRKRTVGLKSISREIETTTFIFVPCTIIRHVPFLTTFFYIAPPFHKLECEEVYNPNHVSFITNRW